MGPAPTPAYAAILSLVFNLFASDFCGGMPTEFQLAMPELVASQGQSTNTEEACPLPIGIHNC